MKTVICLAILIAIACGALRASADGVLQPLISADDRGTDGLLARYSYRVSGAGTQVTTPDARAGLYSLQGFVGPVHDTPLDATSFRVRMTAATDTDTDFRFGPLTLALQRYFPLDPFF